jgi:hypothetical protein
MDKIKQSTEEELLIANRDLVFEKGEKAKLLAELRTAKKELAFLIEEKGQKNSALRT